MISAITEPHLVVMERNNWNGMENIHLNLWISFQKIKDLTI